MSKFQIGDKVRVVKDKNVWLKEDDVHLPDDSVLKVVSDSNCELFDFEIWIQHLNDWPDDFEVFEGYKPPTGGYYITGFGAGLFGEQPSEHMITKERAEELGVYRPNLEDRKVGKVRVELVDDGFPLALREIAKVMTWAQTAKGYKDHDWQNLPEPEQGLSGATSRHRTDNIIQRQVNELAAIECVDHESKLLHKAHEAFGVLAQLELILRGVIK